MKLQVRGLPGGETTAVYNLPVSAREGLPGYSTFPLGIGDSSPMHKGEHGDRLKAAMARRRLDRQTVADAAGVKPRTVTNWTSGTTMPSDSERLALRRLLGDYDNPGDPVEVAVRSSELVGWRQNAVISEYQRHQFEQQRDREAGEFRPS